MTRRRELIWLFAVGTTAAAPAHAAAPSPGNRRLGVLLFDRPETWTFLAPESCAALAELGWIEGRNLSVEWRYADGDAARLPVLAAQIVRTGVDAILTRGTPATRALQQATKTIPIVTSVGDAVGAGFAQSFARPGGNITGASVALVEIQRKRIELLRGMVPGLARLVIVLPAEHQAFVQELTRSVTATAREIGVAPVIALIASTGDLQAALRPDRVRGASAVYVFNFGSAIEPKELADLALRNRMPTMFEISEYVEAGGLMSFTFGWENPTQRSAAPSNSTSCFVARKRRRFRSSCRPARSSSSIEGPRRRSVSTFHAPSCCVRTG